MSWENNLVLKQDTDNKSTEADQITKRKLWKQQNERNKAEILLNRSNSTVSYNNYFHTCDILKIKLYKGEIPDKVKTKSEAVRYLK